MTEVDVLEAPYINIQRKDLVSEVQDLLLIGRTAFGSTSMTFTLNSQGTLGNLIASGLCGIWKNREINDTLEYAKKLRAEAQKRMHGRS